MGQRAVSNDRAFEREIGGINRRLADLARLVPGKDGGGSVASPFTIGGYTIGDDSAQIVLSVLAQLSHPVRQEYEAQFDQGVTTSLGRTRIFDDFLIIGPFVYWRYYYQFAETGTAGAPLTMTMPVAPVSGSSYELGGTVILDDSAQIRYNTFGEVSNRPGQERLQAFGADSADVNFWGEDPNLAIDTQDLVRGWCLYLWE